MEKQRRFSWVDRLVSISHAIDGIVAFFRSEHNAFIHLLATILVSVLMLVLPMKPGQVVCIVIVTGMVWVAEIFNTAIEKMADIISRERHPGIRFIKDVSAAAVLLTALTALVTGCIIFIPKLALLW